MAIKHLGRKAPDLPEAMHGDDHDTFWFSWTDKLNGESITASLWTLPAGFSQEAESENGSVTDDDGTVLEDANSITVSTTADPDRYYISNTITTDSTPPRTLTRGFYVTIASV